MQDHVTLKKLYSLVDEINKKTGSPTASYTRRADGSFVANIGNYHLDRAYGGVQLVRMSNNGGGIQVISRDGLSHKRTLYNWMTAFLQGLDTAKAA